MNQLTMQELEAIRERIEDIWFDKAYVKGDPWKGYEVRCANIGQLIAETSSKIDAEFIANARTDIPKLLAEVDRLREALEFYADGSNNEYELNNAPWYTELKESKVMMDHGWRAKKALEGGD